MSAQHEQSPRQPGGRPGLDPGQRAQSFHRAEVSGPLFKRRGGYGKHMPNSWQSRYFFLIDGVLSYYDSEHVDNGVLLSPDAKPRGLVRLEDARCVFNECAEGEPTQFAIIVYPEHREKWKLCAENLEDYRRWKQALKRFVGNHEEIDELISEGHEEESVPRPRPQGVRHSPPPSSRRASFNQQRKGGRRVRLRRPTSLLSSEAVETFLVAAVLNLCLLLATVSGLYQGAGYLLLANLVVIRTLRLRHERCAEASAQLESVREELRSLESAEEERPVAPVPSPAKGDQLVAQAKPRAGSTFTQVFVAPSSSAPPHTWCRCDHSSFNVRVGPDYARFKRKAPSQPPIYEPFAIDVFW